MNQDTESGQGDSFKDTLDKFQRRWMNHPGVVAIGESSFNSHRIILVYLSDEDEHGIPERFGGIPVFFSVAGRIVKQRKPDS